MADLFSLAAAEEAQGRRRQMLRTAFGPTIAAALADPTVIEVMVNPDGKLWIERVTIGRQDTGERIGSAEAERIVRLVAAHVRREVTDKTPIVSAELPETGERFEGVMPPVSPAPCFAVRKPADVLYRLADYVAARIMSVRQAEVLALSVRERRNILVVLLVFVPDACSNVCTAKTPRSISLWTIYTDGPALLAHRAAIRSGGRDIVVPAGPLGSALAERRRGLRSRHNRSAIERHGRGGQRERASARSCRRSAVPIRCPNRAGPRL